MRIRSCWRGAAAARAGSWLAEPAAREGERSGGRGGGGGGAAGRAARGERAAQLIPAALTPHPQPSACCAAWGARVLSAKRRVSEVHRALHTSPSPSPKSSLKGRSGSAPVISQPPECRKRGLGMCTYGPAGCWASRHDAVGTGGLRGENEERCKLVPEKESKWRFWMCKVHQLRSHFPSSSSPIGREVGEELATPLPQPSSRPPPRPPAPLPRPHARRLALPLSP